LFSSQKKTRTSEGPAERMRGKGRRMRPPGVGGGFSSQNRMFWLEKFESSSGQYANSLCYKELA
jgi:hypothetical protein